MTICTKDRIPLLTKPIETVVGADLCVRPNNSNNSLQLNGIGQIVKHWWNELPNKFPLIKIDEYIIMPNHVHGIIDIVKTGTHTGVPLHRVVQWFKTMTSNNYFKYIKQNGFKETGTLWQRNYYEHIIRNEADLNDIRKYIIHNPQNWASDRNNPGLYVAELKGGVGS